MSATAGKHTVGEGRTPPLADRHDVIRVHGEHLAAYVGAA